MAGRFIAAGYEFEDSDPEDHLCLAPLKITYIPNLTNGAGINGGDFDKTLSPQMLVWFRQYQESWSATKTTPHLTQCLKTVYREDENPLLLALKFFAHCPGCNNLKNKNLATDVLETVCSVCEASPEFKEKCTDDMRMVAFNFLKASGTNTLCKQVVKAYNLKQIKEPITVKLRQMLGVKMYKEVAFWAICLDLTHAFDIFEIVVPLLLQNKTTILIEYLDASEDHRMAMVTFLDSLFDRTKSVSEHLQVLISKYEYSEPKGIAMSDKPMSKMLTRIVKRYNIDESKTPRLNFKKSRCYMGFLYKHYKSEKVGHAAFRELIKDIAVTKPLQLEIIAYVVNEGDLEEGAYWAKYYQVPEEELPLDLRTYGADYLSGSDVIDGAETQDETAQKTNKSDFLQLDLEDDAIIIVDNDEKFDDMLNDLSYKNLISFDSEWKPSAVQTEYVCLLQLATSTRVYLIDVTSKDISHESWKRLGVNVFNNMDIFKIGFSIGQDMVMLQRTLPQLCLSDSNMSGYLDLMKLWKRLQKMPGFSFPYPGQNTPLMGLTDLSWVCLGKHVDKSNQLSNWAQRPLRRDQIIYAALDAHCLIQIYDVITNTLVNAGIDISTVLEKSGVAAPIPTTSRCNFTSQQSPKKSNCDKNIPVDSTNIKFFCDQSLLKFHYILRKLGIDCVSIDLRNVCLSQYGQMAKAENRYVISRESPSSHFLRYFPEYLWVYISDGDSDKGFVRLLQHLNMTIKKNNGNEVRSRCIRCNATLFIKLNRSQMQQMLCPFNFVKPVGNSSVPVSSCKPIKLVYDYVLPTDDVIRKSMTFSNANINAKKIRSLSFLKQVEFYICDTCGRITWPDDYHIPPVIEQKVLNG